MSGSLRDVNIQGEAASAYRAWKKEREGGAARSHAVALFAAPLVIAVAAMLLSMTHTIVILGFFVPKFAAFSGVITIEVVLVYASYYHVAYKGAPWHILTMEIAAAVMAFVMNFLGGLDMLSKNRNAIDAISQNIPAGLLASNMYSIFVFVVFILAVFVPMIQWASGHGVAKYSVRAMEKMRGEDPEWEAVKYDVIRRHLFAIAVKQRTIEKAGEWAEKMTMAYFGQLGQNGQSGRGLDDLDTQKGSLVERLRPVQEVQDVQYSKAVQALSNGLRTSDLAVIMRYNEWLLDEKPEVIQSGLDIKLGRSSIYNAKGIAKTEATDES